METCCQSIIRYLIFIFNFVIAVAGIALTGVNAYFYTQSEDSAFISWIVLGIITFIISFLGCYGSLSENKCMIYTYATILFVISVIEIFIAVSIYDFLPELPTTMRSDMEMYGKNETIRKGCDFMQETFSCCGIINYEDWDHVDWNTTSMAAGSHFNDYEDISSTSPSWTTNSIAPDSHLNEDLYLYTDSMGPDSPLNVPASCCNASPPCTADNVHPVGCFGKVATGYTMASTATIGIALLQMIIGICSCWIAPSSRMGEGNYLIGNS